VLNPRGKSKIRYSDETRDRVLDAVDELGYRLNTTASNFLSGRHGAIGLMMPALGHVPGNVLSSMLRASREGGNKLILEEASDGEEDPPRMFVEDCVDGVILYGFLDDYYREKASELEIPFVDVNSNDRYGPRSITFQEKQGAALAAEAFATAGRQRPAMVLPHNEEHYSVRARYEGFRQAALDRGMADPVVARTGNSRYWYGDAREFLKDHPEVDCILLYDTVLATVLYDELKEVGRTVPDDVAVIGTGYDIVAYTVRPSLTHVFLDERAMGRGIVRALCEVIKENPIPDDLAQFSYGLHERYSTDPSGR
jgi:LacI family transcriptional regulator